MKDEIRKNLIDILQAAEEIQRFTHGMNFKEYQNSPVTQRAVERDFEIIGEALNRIKRMDEELLERISEHYRIIGFRNILIHGYDIIDELIVWKAVENHLPILIKEIHEILNT
ncbi:MAG: DUF86 domain-containing protein [Candidatus Brocadia sp. AMX2]|uniref:DUF86 domain-containing protein n=1 Tax=Candidatus Brocadia sinica JPN1 TaxID=1197129 RepID=A0ABQ0K1D8_9BACT|nr:MULTISPECIES: HepT-like ribonuclease domain-containing protein [Brocadia]MBC6932512.1 DUF86 domain-containing protein [Candidatus Brocadia sp.]MBL1168046.1 DUF86 domain-containing protein [Candidatus Brocadia sp. AMX1]MCK6469263.1 DUF86 domain-containing protein [Candidatus Brocadia sinica]NOG42627.1 DUF86 domain-containing protein [Planctomycetota bacterium]KAA0244020.1 MAG: DUF86 domain-containing protein [Candidatus Brocadia sp. AMX2]